MFARCENSLICPFDPVSFEKNTLLWRWSLIEKNHLRDPCGLCIVLRFEISYFPPRCVAHEEEKQQPYSVAGEMEQYQIFLPIKMNN